MAIVFSHLIGKNPNRFLASRRSCQLETFASTVVSRATLRTASTTLWLSVSTRRSSSRRSASRPTTISAGPQQRADQCRLTHASQV